MVISWQAGGFSANAQPIDQVHHILRTRLDMADASDLGCPPDLRDRERSLARAFFASFRQPMSTIPPSNLSPNIFHLFAFGLEACKDMRIFLLEQTASHCGQKPLTPVCQGELCKLGTACLFLRQVAAVQNCENKFLHQFAIF